MRIEVASANARPVSDLRIFFGNTSSVGDATSTSNRQLTTRYRVIS